MYYQPKARLCISPPPLPYSSELNPIEQFWSVIKSRSKRERLLQKKTLSSRISEACNNVLYSDLQGFCHDFASKWHVCIDKQPFPSNGTLCATILCH